MMYPRRRDRVRIALLQLTLLLLFAAGVAAVGVMLGYCTAVYAETVTFTKARTCGTVTVSRRGLDVVIRCDGAVYLTIVNQPLTCPAFRYVSDAKGNPTIIC